MAGAGLIILQAKASPSSVYFQPIEQSSFLVPTSARGECIVCILAFV